ncbi:alpha/beta fold hydrolase [Chroococcidiopsis sp.]|uniref:alpha/beta fold hydrolase n=1 Tax=Chroococcidiopsis sp. TaxID=3088168 RepID=UPI000B6A4C91|nr:hydrolase [cyanobacterium TDX16]
MSIAEHQINVGSLEWFYREVAPIGMSDLLPVVLLHGLPSHSYGWRHVMPALGSQGTRAIAPDLIGFGSSAKPQVRDFKYTPDAFVQALDEFIQALEIDRFCLVVQGFLGSVGLQYALHHSDRVENIAILNTPLTTAAKLPWQMQQWGLPFAGDMATQDPLLVDRTLEGGSRYQISDADLDVFRKPFLKSSKAGRSLMTTVRNLKMSPSMTEIADGFQDWKKPLLIVWGVNDPWLPVEIAQKFASNLPQAEIVKLEKAGHYPQEHFAEDILQDLLPFVRRAS